MALLVSQPPTGSVRNATLNARACLSCNEEKWAHTNKQDRLTEMTATTISVQYVTEAR